MQTFTFWLHTENSVLKSDGFYFYFGFSVLIIDFFFKLQTLCHWVAEERFSIKWWHVGKLLKTATKLKAQSKCGKNISKTKNLVIFLVAIFQKKWKYCDRIFPFKKKFRSKSLSLNSQMSSLPCASRTTSVNF
jgi:hypothetical protein